LQMLEQQPIQNVAPNQTMFAYIYQWPKMALAYSLSNRLSRFAFIV